MPADLLVLAPHPDDAEISCGGTIARHVRLGATVALVDATRGELGSRGSVEERAQEAAAAARVLGLAARENLGLPDGFLLDHGAALRQAVVDALRRHRPRAVLCMSGHARHPDHVALAATVAPALKAAAFHRLPSADGAPAHSGMRLWFYEAELRIAPDLLVPLSAEDWRAKLAAIACYRSQLHDPARSGPATTIATPGFLPGIEERGRAWGREAGAAYAEAFTRAHDVPRIGDLRDA